MKSTTTRLAASVLAISIPFAPTAAFAEETQNYRETRHLSGVSFSPAALTQTIESADLGTRALSTHDRAALISAIESATFAAQASIEFHSAAQSGNSFAVNYLEELQQQAYTAIDAAYAEAQHARSLVPESATDLQTAFDLILEDLRALRG